MNVSLKDANGLVIAQLSKFYFVEYLNSSKYKFPLRISANSDVYALNSSSFMNRFYTTVELPK